MNALLIPTTVLLCAFSFAGGYWLGQDAGTAKGKAETLAYFVSPEAIASYAAEKRLAMVIEE